MLRNLRTIFILLILLFGAWYSWENVYEHKVESHTEAWSDVVNYARSHFTNAGVLTKKSHGFVYLKVDDNYIHELFPMLKLKGFKEPPYFRSPEAPGAHISVFYSDERISPQEVGQVFHFELKKITIVDTHDARYAILQVESPELEKLRSNYGLNPKLNGKEFHITLAKKYR